MRWWHQGTSVALIAAGTLLLITAGLYGVRTVQKGSEERPIKLTSTADLGPGPTRLFVVENQDDARYLAKLHATANNELLFTTYQFTHKGEYSANAIHMAKHMWENLREVDLLEHTIMLSYDLHSCQVMWEHGIPCFLDRWLPQPKDLPGQYGSEVPHWYQKYAWALKFLEFGYVTVFMELDAIFFESPLPYYNPHLDLEGLSDWKRIDLSDAKGRFTAPCTVYHMQKGQNNDNYLDWGGNRPEDSNSQYHINPCMSTGFWIAQPRKHVRAFLEGFIDLELNWRNWQTDQRLWNEVIMAYMVGHGTQEPLKFSLLNNTKFCNFEIDEKRREEGLPRQYVMMHAGAMRGSEKEPYMRSHGYWKADIWNETSTADHITFLSRYFQRKLPMTGRDHLGPLLPASD